MTQYGGPEALHEIDVPTEELSAAHVRIAVSYAAVNPTDTAIRAGMRSNAAHAPSPGEVPGMDIAGTVADVSPGADLAVGDKVVGLVLPSGTHGAYREEIVLPLGSVVRSPEHLSAATLPRTAMTARRALDLFALDLVQLAKAEGLTVIADAAPKDEELVRSLGPDDVVPRGDDVANHIRRIAPHGVDGLADASVQSELVLPAVKEGGAVATFRGYREDGSRQLRVEPVMVADVIEERAMLAELRDHAQNGVLTLNVAEASRS